MQNRKEKIDVLVTFYNQESYVDRALKSVLEQKTDFEFKVLVGDDGSSDRTREYIEKWSSEYPDKIKMFVMPRENKRYVPGFRASQNRLNLLKHVCGQYFIYLDGDDFWDDETKLQQQADILDAPENQGCIACGHPIDALFTDGTRKNFGGDERLKEGIIDAKEYWKYSYLHTDTLLFRSSVIEKLPLDLLKSGFNDNLITFTIIQHGDIYFLPKTMAVYAQTMDGIWTGEKKVISQIRSMTMVDLCRMIGPEMEAQSRYKFGAVWFGMLRLRKQLSGVDLSLYEAEALEINLKYTLMWIHYPQSGRIRKVQLLTIAVLKAGKTFIRAALSKIRRQIVKK